MYIYIYIYMCVHQYCRQSRPQPTWPTPTPEASGKYSPSCLMALMRNVDGAMLYTTNNQNTLEDA